MKIKTLLIAPYPGLVELAAGLGAEQNDLEVTVKRGDLYEALEIAKDAAAEGYELIISRGGTAGMLREHIDLPVIEIPVSGYDILRTLLLVKDIQASMELIGFANVCDAAASVCKLMNIDLPYSVIYQMDQVEHWIEEARNNGVHIVIGDAITIRTAQKFGLQGIMITSGRESILDAFSNARLIHQIVTRERIRSKALESNLEINLNQSLKDIEREVIRRVMEAEHMNQSRAAERLGISRTTLWRKWNN